MRKGIGEFTVGANVYKYEELAPMEGLRYGTQCAKVLGPAIATLADIATSWNAEKLTLGDLAGRIAPAFEHVDDEKLEALMKTALARVYTPCNESLGDEAVFNSWFKEHKGEMFQVGLWSIYHLARDFFPRLPGTQLTESPKAVQGS